MQVLNSQSAIIPNAKITEYLLSPTHPDGKHKAVFFEGFGFTADDWHELSRTLRLHVNTHRVARIQPSRFGTRYVVEGTMETPAGESPLVRTVWFIENDDDVPRFVTAYSLRRLEND